MTEKPLYYIAGPYTHSDKDVMRQRLKDHAKVSAAMMSEGYLVYSPICESAAIAYDGKMQDTTWDTWREKDIRMIDLCDELIIICIDGWQESKGVRGEVKHCLKTGKRIGLLDPTIMAIFDIETATLLREFEVKTEAELND